MMNTTSSSFITDAVWTIQRFWRKLFMSQNSSLFGGSIFNSIRQQFWLWFYNSATRNLKNDARWQFINYGYIPEDGKLVVELKEKGEDKCGNSCIQLYHEVANAVPIKGKNVVEIGSGRGGGASYIARYLQPASMTAVDLSAESVEFANKLHKTGPNAVKNLHFMQGDALNLTALPDGAYDVVVNVESSHCYPSVPKFLSEVVRILKPGGYFVMCDVRFTDEIPIIEEQMIESGLVMKENVNITDGVIRSMKKNSETRKALLKEGVSGIRYMIFGRSLESFSGLENSRMYRGFEAGETQYKRYVLQKPE